jgi:diphosphomevalonate decarboxylase
MSTPEQKYSGPVFVASAPSNIALLKYWGKSDPARQWPANSSFSMTLDQARTTTRAQIARHDEIWFSGKQLPLSDPKASRIIKHLDLLRAHCGSSAKLHVATENTFPAGCGIASSASGFAALTLACMSALTGESVISDDPQRQDQRYELAQLAHMGSGSAGRSLWGGWVAWMRGTSPETQSFEPLAPAHHMPLQDLIVIFSSTEKTVSSSEGHKTASTSPLWAPRQAGLESRFSAMLAALKNKDLEKLGDLAEAEALEMHAVMLSSSPQACYLTPATSDFLAWVRRTRARGDLPAWFTLDAGPNVHLLCAPEDRDAVLAQIRREYSQQFGDLNILVDQTGLGPKLTRLVATREFTSGVEHVCP